jgi:hypothetical protein
VRIKDSLAEVASAVRKHRAWPGVADSLLAVACFAASLALYLWTLAPSVATLFDDSLEFPLVAYRLGIAHPTGYPLYTLLARLFILLGPWREVAQAVNALSAVAAAWTTALVFLVARQVTRRRLPALLGAAGLATSPVFWSQSVIAEVYTLNAAFVAALLLVALRWSKEPLSPVTPFSRLWAEPGPGLAWPSLFRSTWDRLPPAVVQGVAKVRQTYRRFFPAVPPKSRLHLHPRIYLLVALYGLSLAHHRTVLLLAPALLFFVLLVEYRTLTRAALLGPEQPAGLYGVRLMRQPAIRLALCLLAPLLFYLYLPLRGGVGSLDGRYVNTWSGFWRWVTTGGYGVFLSDNPLARNLGPSFYADLFRQQLGLVGLALALVGVISLVRRPKVLALTGLAFVAFTLFALSYRVPDVEVFFIPAFLVATIWIAAGLDHAADLLRPRGPSLGLRRLMAASGLLVFVAAAIQPALMAVRNWPDLDLSRSWAVHDYARYALDQPRLPDSTVVGLLGEMTLLRYFQETAGLRPELETVAANGESERRSAVDAALARGREVLVTRSLPGLAEDYALSAVIGLIDLPEDAQTLVRVGQPNYDTPAPPRLTSRELFPGLRLLGYGVWEHRGHWQAWARLRLWWQAPQGLQQVGTLKVSARLLDADGYQVATVDGEPAAWTYPAWAWRAGEVVLDAYEIPLPAGTPPGAYTPLIIVYDSETGLERGRATLDAVSLEGNPARPPRRALEASIGRALFARFGEVELLGLTLPGAGTAYSPGQVLPVTLLWQAPREVSGQAQGRPAAGLSLVVWLEGEGRYVLAEVPVGGAFPMASWRPAQTVRQWLDLRVPEDTPTGNYRLKLRVYRAGQPLPWGRGLLPFGTDLDLGPVPIGP